MASHSIEQFASRLRQCQKEVELSIPVESALFHRHIGDMVRHVNLLTGLLLITAVIYVFLSPITELPLSIKTSSSLVFVPLLLAACLLSGWRSRERQCGRPESQSALFVFNILDYEQIRRC